MILAATLAAFPFFFTNTGTLRAYVFQRLNAVGQNQRAWNFGGTLHTEATLKSHPLSFGATYAFAAPLGTNGPNPKTNAALDNTLPGYSQSSLSELYVQYRWWHDFVQVGKFQLQTPFANSADGRLIPVTYQGAQARHYFGGGWNVGLLNVARFKSRTSSTFDATDLISKKKTGGFTMLEVSHGGHGLTATLDRYWFSDIANLTYLNAHYDFNARTSIDAQAIGEEQAGRALVGAVHSHTYGAQIAARIGVVNAALGFDATPPVMYITTNPAGIFQPVGAPAPQALGGGRFSVIGGGVASPYTDGYVADPHYTTSIASSQVDRRSPGTSYKFALSGTAWDGHVPWQFSRAHYDYLADGIADETDADITLNLGRIDPTKTYTGLSFRQRWGYRTSSFNPLRFLYARTQLQYTF